MVNNLGIANNTLVIFTSDNGAALVDKDRGKKQEQYKLVTLSLLNRHGLSVECALWLLQQRPS